VPGDLLGNLYTWRNAAAFTFLAIPLAVLAEWTWHRLRSLPPYTRTNEILPSLSIVIPARNEEHNLGALLDSLCRLEYPGCHEVIVVDDNSTDATAAVAAAHGARVITLTGLPEGWKGKPNACHQGATAANGEWLLFTDADTVHAAEGPARAVKLALAEGLDGLSVHPCMRYRGLADRLALTAAHAGLFAMGAPAQGMLNGQFILVRRAVYEASGGFAAVRDETLEDVALGRRLRDLGYDAPMANGSDIMQVRMYTSQPQMWRGLSRLGDGAFHWWGVRALLPGAFITALVSPLVALVGAALGELHPVWPAAVWAVAAACLWQWSRRAGSPADALLAPLGALIMLLASLWGLISRALGVGINWKGRKV
jgi:chlorobactene glucosyltransferase